MLKGSDNKRDYWRFKKFEKRNISRREKYRKVIYTGNANKNVNQVKNKSINERDNY